MEDSCGNTATPRGNFANFLLELRMVGVSVRLERAAIPSATVNLLYPVLALFLTIFAIAPLTFPGFFQSHTGYSAVYNLIDLNSSDARFFAWAPTWGRAYDFFRMDGALGYWLAEIFHLVGFSFLASIKIIYALAFLGSALGMFQLARRVLKNDAAALLASALYVYFPAHIAAVYIHGAFGEAVAWSLFPFAFSAAIAFGTKTRRTWRDALFCISAFALLVLAQAGLAILFAILAAVWLFVLEKQRGRFFGISVGAMLLGLVLGFVLQIPALAQQSAFLNPNGFVAAFVYPFQLLSASWGSDVPRGNFTDNAPYQIGFAALGLTIVAVALVLRQGEGENSSRRVLWFVIGVSVVLLVLMMPLAEFLWNIGLNLFLQYPFQLLAFVGFFLSLAAASLVIYDARFREIPLLAALVIVPVLAVYPYLAPEFTEFSPTRPALARFNNELALLDANIVRPPGIWRHGATVELDLTWQALKQPNRDYTVFLKILDEQGNEWGATDEKPQGGTLSTLKMIPSRVYSDTHTVQIDLAGPNEGYHLVLGIYQTTTGERAVTEIGATEIRIDENQ